MNNSSQPLAPLDVGVAGCLPEAGPDLEEAEAVPGGAEDAGPAPPSVLGVQQVPPQAGLGRHPLQEHHVRLQLPHHVSLW